MVSAQLARPINKLAAGRLLVARRDLPDPNFAETVVFLTQYDRKGAMGFIINRRTKLDLARLFRDSDEAKNRTDPVYMGGPVGLDGALGLLRTSTKPADARLVFSDVYLISSKEGLEKALAMAKDPSSLRVFLGYAGWAAGQLEAEVELGMWHIFDSDAAAIFDSDPATLWLRLIKQTELRIVRAVAAAAWESL